MQVLRCEVAEVGHAALPPIDLSGRVAIGSGIGAQLRLPASAGRDVSVEIVDGTWLAHADILVDGAPHVAGSRGELGAAATFTLGGYRVTVRPAPIGTLASPPQRTESLARELVRAMLGGDSAPSLTIERGPGAGAKRVLPPPEATVVIGRGDEATWVIADADLSRAHAELRRGWDGVVIVDLGSKNGTRVDGARVRGSQPLHDGAQIVLANVTLRFHDPAERHLRGLLPAPIPAPPPPSKRSTVVIAVCIAALALAGLVWVLAS